MEQERVEQYPLVEVCESDYWLAYNIISVVTRLQNTIPKKMLGLCWTEKYMT